MVVDTCAPVAFIIGSWGNVGDTGVGYITSSVADSADAYAVRPCKDKCDGTRVSGDMLETSDRYGREPLASEVATAGEGFMRNENLLCSGSREASKSPCPEKDASSWVIIVGVGFPVHDDTANSELCVGLDRLE